MKEKVIFISVWKAICRDLTLLPGGFSIWMKSLRGAFVVFSSPFRCVAIALLALLGSALPVVGFAADGEKIFRTNLNDDLQTIDPFSFTGLITYNLLSQVYQGFTALSPDGRVVPALATSWHTPDGGWTWRIVLRSGVRFHSGREFTAEDVRWTFVQLLKKRPQPSLGAFELRQVVGAQDVEDGRTEALAGVTVIDRYTVDVHFTAPDAVFPLVPFFFVDSGIVAQYGPDWVGHGSAGTGPFRLVSWRRNQDVVLAAHRDYWGGAPSVDGVRFSVIPHAETLLARYNSGALDFVVIPELVARSILNDHRYDAQRLTFPRSQIRYIGMNQALYPPFRDIRVREAVGLALDRDSIVTGLYRGAATRMDGVIPSDLGGYRAGNVAPVPYDPAQAKRLLAEAGYGEGHPPPPLELVGTDNVRDEVTVYAGQLSAVLGISVGVLILERGAQITAANQGQLPFFVSGWTADYPDALTVLRPVWYGASPFNRSRWHNPGFDRLIDEAETVSDPNQRHLLCQEAERVLISDRAVVPLPVPMSVALARPGVTGVHVLPMGMLDLRDSVLP
jgi:ABC-type transport system substrate-binding protein